MTFQYLEKVRFFHRCSYYLLHLCHRDVLNVILVSVTEQLQTEVLPMRIGRRSPMVTYAERFNVLDKNARVVDFNNGLQYEH